MCFSFLRWTKNFTDFRSIGLLIFLSRCVINYHVQFIGGLAFDNRSISEKNKERKGQLFKWIMNWIIDYNDSTIVALPWLMWVCERVWLTLFHQSSFATVDHFWRKTWKKNIAKKQKFLENWKKKIKLKLFKI